MKYVYVEWLRTIVDWPLGTILGVLLALAALLVVGLVLYGLFYVIDSSFLPVLRAPGKVFDKEFVPAHTTYVSTWNPALKITTTTPVHHPDTWNLGVAVVGQRDYISVYQSFYDNTDVGDKVTVDYVLGRISRRVYLRQIYAAQEK